MSARERLQDARLAVALALVAALAVLPQPGRAQQLQRSLDSGDRMEGHVVVLLHGLGRSSWGMKPLASRLRSEGYEVHNLDYPSRDRAVADLADYLGAQLGELGVDDASRLHFVTHSMGGIVVRAYLDSTRPRNLGRVVMLSPPNHGTEIVDQFRNQWWFEMAFGPAAVSLGTRDSDVPEALGPAWFDVGVLMGRRSLSPLGSFLINGEDDGVLSVESAKLSGMRDFRVLDRTHTFIMMAGDTADEVVHYLEHGMFSPEP